MSHHSTDNIFHWLASDEGTKAEESSDSRLHLSESELEQAMKAKELEERDESLRGHKQDREQRKIFSSRIFIFMCAYMLISLIIVFCCGLGFMYLSDAILITLLTTSLANVIGVFNFVAKYLFHKT